MKKITVLLLLLFLTCFASCVIAADGERQNASMPTPGKSAVIQPSNPKFHEMVENAIKVKNGGEAETIKSGINKIEYNTDGTLKKVVYNNGDYLSYVHMYDNGGNWMGCSIFNDKIKIDIAKTFDGGYFISVSNAKGTGIGAFNHETADPGTGTGDLISNEHGQMPGDKPIIIYCPKDKADWSRLAKDPIEYEDVKKIEQSITKVSDASKEFGKTLNNYYAKLEQKICEKAAQKNIADPEIKKYAEKLSNGLQKNDKVKIVDEFIEYLNILSKNDPAQNDLKEILEFKEKLDKAVLIDARNVLKDKINGSIREITEIFDNIAVMYIKKDKKIDVLINLPKAVKDTK